jgi:mono/diheme cytochrome c family protein
MSLNVRINLSQAMQRHAIHLTAKYLKRRVASEGESEMTVGLTTACCLILAGGLLATRWDSFTLDAQTATPATEAKPGLPETEEQKQGEALFWRDCSLCHVERSSPRYNHRGRKTLGIVASTDLVGVYKRASITDAHVRQVIEEGIPGKMPAFKYTYALKPGAVDQLVAYLKVR